jgi:hypothetical protein
MPNTFRKWIPTDAQVAARGLEGYCLITSRFALSLFFDMKRCAGNRELARMAHKLLTSPALAKKKGLKKACPPQEQLSSLLERFACNDFSIWDELLISVGSGCYPLGAILNHSCEPNCVLSFSLSTEHRQVIRVIKDVRAGEELCHAYIDIAKPTPEVGI